MSTQDPCLGACFCFSCFAEWGDQLVTDYWRAYWMRTIPSCYGRFELF